MIKIKICGITREEDAQYSIKLGAWALGFIFVKETPRYITNSNAKKIISTLPKNIEKIGVFADESIDSIEKTFHETGLTKIQLHGDESPEFCEKLSKTVDADIIKAFRIKDKKDLDLITNYKNKISFMLLDSYSSNSLGGTGKSFDWDIAIEAKKAKIPLIIAGGINTDNAKKAYSLVEPYALDISSGAEATKGIKDFDKLQKIFESVSNL